MNPWFAKAIILVSTFAMLVIPHRLHGPRGSHLKVVKSRRGPLEVVLLTLVSLGFVLPLVWVATPVFAFADYPLRSESFSRAAELKKEEAMQSKFMSVGILAALLIGLGIQVMGQERQKTVNLAPEKLELHKVKAEHVTYRGRAAVRITDTVAEGDDVDRLAIVHGTSFQDGTIEVTLSGDTAPDAPPGFRGFVGIAFRVTSDGSHYECFYLRPKNGRSEDQLQRNHSVQYISLPGFPWQKLRSESPGKYESYVDLVPGEWTRVKIQVVGSGARLYVNGSEQPVLIVNDLKQAPVNGSIALWVGNGTIAHFFGLKVTSDR